MRRFTSTLALCLMAVLFGACPEDTVATGTCASDRDCPADQICSAGVCTESISLGDVSISDGTVDSAVDIGVEVSPPDVLTDTPEEVIVDVTDAAIDVGPETPVEDSVEGDAAAPDSDAADDADPTPDVGGDGASNANCGNGFQEDGEECDDGNDNDDDTCRNDCTLSCGDGILQSVEACDTAIPAGDEGACPTDCTATDVCTVASVEGNECQQVCVTAPVSECVDGDGCCGFGCNNLEDPECASECDNGVVEAGETCDPSGTCPLTCDDGNACTEDVQTGAIATCDVACTSTPIESCADDDGCCPTGCNAGNDNDCSASCGDSFIDDGETCDPPGSCPTSCDDSDPCTTDTLTGSAENCNVACSNVAIVDVADNDGCCPASGNANTDNDCQAQCDNSVQEAGETCDPVSSCPTGIADCNDGLPCTTDDFVGDPNACTAQCVFTDITAAADGDGCCLAGDDATTDSDCAAVCDNGVLEPGETCDPLNTCPAAVDCVATDPCTTATYQGDPAGCTAECVIADITTPTDGDGCCPPAGNAGNDTDCQAVCGNDIVEPGETCEPSSGCPALADCDDSNPCTADTLDGSAQNCDAVCVNTPIEVAADGDGCCPAGANASTDSDCSAVCGNGALEAGETCDPIATCPVAADCADTDPCTTDALIGSAANCDAECTNTAITLPASGDGCCPTGANANNDSDCSAACGNDAVEPGETCDPPGSCPVAGDCDDANACTADALIGDAALCTAECTNTAIEACADGDGCCPGACTATNDSDCSATCGNGTVEAGETCDPPNTCPKKNDCVDDNDPCTVDELVGSSQNCNAECTYVPITAAIDNDGCCPTGANSGTDNDCAVACGNGAIESGETCDPPGSCPTLADCDDSNPCTADTLTGDANSCDAQCVNTPITAAADGDGCCPSGANANTDSDCNPVCDNGVVEAGEQCDPIASCPSACDDGQACTTDTLVGSAASCTAECVFTDITVPTDNDGCCPPAGDANNDNDCAAVCDNGVIEPGETCDPVGSCPTTCDDGNACTADVQTGAAATCDIACTNTPITAAADGDGCCPAGENATTDSDCAAVCDNGVVEGNETCDPVGSCPTLADCDDSNACTADTLSGAASTCTAECLNTAIETCIDADGCCPTGCNATNDSDCSPVCDNGVLEAGETCDPAANCPTSCDDSDACTTDALTGSAATCDVTCTNDPITTCVAGDGCCPSGCDVGSDSDCAATLDPASAVVTTSSCLTLTTQAQAAVVVTLVDTNGGPLTGATVAMSTTAGTLSAVSSDGNTYWAILTPPASGTDATITVVADGTTLNTTPTVTFAAPFSDLQGGWGGCPADGNVRVRAVTPNGAPIPNARVMIGLSPSITSFATTFNAPADGPNTGQTDAGGFVQFRDFETGLDGTVTVTAVVAGSQYVTAVDVNASDFVLPLELVAPVVPTGVYTGDITGISVSSGEPIELGVMLPEIDLDQFVNFSLDTLLADNECYAAGGFAGDSNIPGNIYLPQQCAATLFFACAQNLPEHPYTSAPIPYGPHRLSGLAGDAPLDALTGGDIGAALSQITFTQIGSQTVNVSAPGPTTQDIAASTNLLDDVSCTINNAPADSDVFCLTAGDWDSASLGVTPGAGSLYMMGLRVADTAASGQPTTLNNLTRAPDTGAFNTDKIAAAAAVYLDDTKAGIVPGTADGISIIAQRGSLTTSLTFDNFLSLRVLSRAARDYGLGALSAGPTAHYSRSTMVQNITQTYSGCGTDDSTRNIRRTLWTVYAAGSSAGFTLPTPPTSWPRADLPGDLAGLVDVTATPADDVLEWNNTTIHEGLNTGHDYNAMFLSGFRLNTTHATTNTNPY